MLGPFMTHGRLVARLYVESGRLTLPSTRTTQDLLNTCLGTPDAWDSTTSSCEGLTHERFSPLILAQFEALLIRAMMDIELRLSGA